MMHTDAAYGVMPWREDNRYARIDAVKVYVSRKVAQTGADRCNDKDGCARKLVVRSLQFLPETR